jgi:hypothetical protein
MAQITLNSTGVASNGSLVLQSNGTTAAVTVDTAQNVGVGVTPSAWNTGGKAIEVKNGGNGLYSTGTNTLYQLSNGFLNSAGDFKYSNTNFATQYTQYNGTHSWATAPSGTAGNTISFTQAMTLDSSGNLGIGTTSPAAKLNIVGGDAYFYNTANLGGIRIGYDGSNYWSIQRENASTGRLGFFNGTSEKVSIDTSGNLLVGTTTASAAITNGFTVVSPAGTTALGIGHINGSGSGTNYVLFNYNGSIIGSITQSGTTAVLYNLTSDQRLKENIQDSESASSLIDSIQVRQYNWKSDGSHQRYGFIAQELVTVAPEAVYQPTDQEEMMAVDYSKLVPMLVKEIQSLRKRLAALESN